MRTVIKLVAFVAFAAAMGYAQCDKDPAGGTVCVAPLKTKVPPGQSPTFSIDTTPATPGFPCVKQAAGSPNYRLCGQNNQITVDFGDGNGFVSLKGKDGNDGKAASITIGSVSSGPTPAAWNSGTDTDAILNLVLPKGDKGDIGVVVGQTLFGTGSATCAPAPGGTVPKGFTCAFKNMQLTVTAIK